MKFQAPRSTAPRGPTGALAAQSRSRSQASALAKSAVPGHWQLSRLDRCLAGWLRSGHGHFRGLPKTNLGQRHLNSGVEMY